MAYIKYYRDTKTLFIRLESTVDGVQDKTNPFRDNSPWLVAAYFVLLIVMVVGFLLILGGYRGNFAYVSMLSNFVDIALYLKLLPTYLFRDEKEAIGFFEGNRGKKVMIESMWFYVLDDVSVKYSKPEWYMRDITVEGVIKVDERLVDFSWA